MWSASWGGAANVLIPSHPGRFFTRVDRRVCVCVCSRKKEAREVHRRSAFAQKVHGLRAKLYNAKRYKEKATMRKT